MNSEENSKQKVPHKMSTSNEWTTTEWTTVIFLYSNSKPTSVSVFIFGELISSIYQTQNYHNPYDILFYLFEITKREHGKKKGHIYLLNSYDKLPDAIIAIVMRKWDIFIKFNFFIALIMKLILFLFKIHVNLD